MATVEVHTIESDLLGQMGLIFCASFIDENNQHAGESHLLIRDADQTIISKSIRFEQMPPENRLSMTDDNVMLQCALGEAHQSLSNYLENHQRDSIKYTQWERAKIKSADASIVLRAWILDNFPKMKNLYSSTLCEELRLYLKPIISASKVRTEWF